jgi:hypothetical protein
VLPLQEVVRELERAAGVTSRRSMNAPDNNNGSGNNVEVQCEGEVQKARRFAATRWFLERYWSERHEQLERDAETFLATGGSGSSEEDVADALLSFLYCDGEFERLPNRSVAALGRSASRFFMMRQLKTLQDCRDRIEEVRVLVGMKFVLDVGATLSRWKRNTTIPGEPLVEDYEQQLQAITIYGSPVRHVLSGIEGYFLLARHLASWFLELSDSCAEVISQRTVSTRLYSLMASLAGIHMQSFVALEELLRSSEDVELETGTVDGKERVLISSPQAAEMAALHAKCRGRDNTRARARIGCPAFASAMPMAARFHERMAVPLITQRPMVCDLRARR